MENKKIIIAIDGYSSTGKSTFAKLLAAKLAYIYVDTGALYRAITYFAFTNGFIDNKNKIDKVGLKSNLSNINLEFKVTELGSSVYLNSYDLGDSIRSLEISQKVSHIAELPFVRNYVDNMLKEYGDTKGVVMDGRDIGTAVFPNAELKIFMTASDYVRAKRRYDEMQGKGLNEPFDRVLLNLKERDLIDQTRKKNPLTKAPDAFVLDNTELTVEQEFKWVGEILFEKFKIKLS